MHNEQEKGGRKRFNRMKFLLKCCRSKGSLKKKQAVSEGTTQEKKKKSLENKIMIKRPFEQIYL